MNQPNDIFLMQYALRRTEIAAVCDEFAAAYDEDLRVNADMFDIQRTTISGNPHPNDTMRALEKRLAQADLPLLHTLSAMLAVGRDIVLGLAELEGDCALLLALSEEYELVSGRPDSAAMLAADLTVPKAEHQLRRLRTVMRMLDDLSSEE